MGEFSGLNSHAPTQPASAVSGPCLAEVSWIIERPEFEGSERLRSLLLYLAEKSDHSATTKVTQKDIARDIMGLGSSYDPSCDAHVRIEVKRLRAALDGFYARLQQARNQRLSVPKGKYRTVLETIPDKKPVVHISQETGDPIVAFGTLCADENLSRSYGFEIESEMLTEISASELFREKLLSFTCVEGGTLEALATQAERQGACVLLVLRVMAVENQCNVCLTAIMPRTRQIINNTRLNPGSGAPGHQQIIQSISQACAFQALDPIGGGLVKIVSELLPQSKISRLADAFTFMATQDRRLLPKALTSVKLIARSSDIAQALFIDMSRASFCFSTDTDLQDISFLEDASEALAEKKPESPWANLALGYAGVSGNRMDLVNRAVSRLTEIQPVGSQGEDYNLLRSLSGMQPAYKNSAQVGKYSTDRSVFEEIRIGLAALHDPSNAFANDTLQASQHRDVFWIQAFQISALMDKGKKSKALEVYERMRRLHPNVEDYMHRALRTMLPDVDLGSKVSSELRMVMSH